MKNMEKKETDIYGNEIEWESDFGYEDEAGEEILTEETEKFSQVIQETQKQVKETTHRFGLNEVIMLIIIAIFLTYLFVFKRKK